MKAINMTTQTHIFSNRLLAIKQARQRLDNIAAAAVGERQKAHDNSPKVGPPPAVTNSVQMFVEDFAAQTLAQINTTAGRLQAMHAAIQAKAMPPPATATTASEDVIDVVARKVADPIDPLS